MEVNLIELIERIKTSQRSQHNHIKTVLLGLYKRVEKLETLMQEKPKELSTADKVDAIKQKYKEEL